MAHIVVVGAGIGGMSAAYELRGVLGNGHRGESVVTRRMPKVPIFSHFGGDR